MAAAITGEPARGPRVEGVGAEEITDIILALVTGVLPPAMLVELIRAWSFTTVSRKQRIRLVLFYLKYKTSWEK